MKRKFNVTLERIQNDLNRTAKKLGYTKALLLKSKTSSTGVVKLVGTKPKTIQCTTFDNHDDNLRAIGLTLEYQRRIREEYGAEMVRQTSTIVTEPRPSTPTSLRLGSGNGTTAYA